MLAVKLTHINKMAPGIIDAQLPLTQGGHIWGYYAHS